jgi:hypothetical protein
MALVGTFLIGCAVLLAVGCAGVRSEAPKEKQGQAEDTKQEQGHSPEATASEEARCERTRTTKVPRMAGGIYTTNDLPGCPKGGLLLGTNKADKLYGGDGDDEIRGLSAKDDIAGGDGNDVIHAGPGDDVFLWDGKGDDVIYGGDGDDEFIDDKGDDVIYGGDGNDFYYPTSGKDVIHGGDGNDFIDVAKDGQPDKFYCGKGKDEYGLYNHTEMDKNDYVDSSCEKKVKIKTVS